jgi:hypothetical protein
MTGSNLVMVVRPSLSFIRRSAFVVFSDLQGSVLEGLTAARGMGFGL